jgi:hypothetical protein
MNIYEVDFRFSWISSIIESLEYGLSNIEQRVNGGDWFDGLWELEHAESIYGIAFVVAQTYILGTTQDINRIRQGAGKSPLDKLTLYSYDLRPLNKQVSRIRLINAIANYHKHKDEWTSWPQNNTTRDLAAAGIDATIEFPCQQSAVMLWDEQENGSLKNLMAIISEWRRHILDKYK